MDVYEEEPVLGANHPLLKMSNVLCTPHLGYAERGAYEDMYATAADQLIAFAEGRPTDVMNPDVLVR